eukprot:Nitzschia sp. Nitz4//scaffold13_size275219//219063//220247//NITZ4_000909-RA/size275219-processed-gene-0.107-mRNA-1//1//CDS//3329536119//1410//frame0
MSESNNNINAEVPDPEEWEEWDGKSPFWIHCVAGSMAGVAEHTVVFPLDTVRTHIQVCASCNFNPQASAAAASAAPSVGQTTTLGNVAIQHTTPFPRGAAASASASTPVPQAAGMFQTIRTLVSQPMAMEGVAGAGALSTSTGSSTVVSQLAGFGRLWRGVQSVLVGCIPAHALYFGSYEFVKASTLDENGEVTAYGSALAGAAAVTGHDMVLAPLDTVKQRLQLGHYRGLSHALSTMIASEGLISLYRSFPVTLATNIPYGIVMVGTNEFLKQQWSSNGELTLGVTMASSSMAGFVAAGMTTPLDRIKTSLQTQQLAPACAMGTAPPDCPMKKVSEPVVVAGWREAAIRIYETEGMTGFFRGLAPRVLSHTPAVAISWTAYETFKRYLQRTEW